MVRNTGLVDLDLEVPPSCPTAKFQFSKAEQWNDRNKVNQPRFPTTSPTMFMSYLEGRHGFGGSGRVLDGFWSGGVMVSGVLEERREEEERKLR